MTITHAHAGSQHPLVELSSATSPEEIQHPIARKAILSCSALLQKHLPPGRWPYPYQMVGAAYAHLARDVCLIADDMGLGKTIQGISRIVCGQYRRTAIVCPASMLGKWQEDLASWLPDFQVCLLDGQNRAPPSKDTGITLTTWDLLKYGHDRTIQRFRPDLLIFDEAHAVKNGATFRYKAAWEVRQCCPRLILLTGTPIINAGVDLWTLLNLLDPSAWPEVTKPSFDELDKDDIDLGFQTRLITRVREFMIRRLKANIPDIYLPEKAHRVIRVELSTETRNHYDRANKAFGLWLERHLSQQAEEAAAQLGRVPTPEDVLKIYKRVESATSREYLTKMGYLRGIVGPAKVPAALAWIAQMRAAQEPVVVFFERQQVHQMLMEGLDQRGIAYESIVGSTPKSVRTAAVKRFQALQAPVMLASQAGREGITLTAARHMLRVERWWNPAVEAQADDRIHRIGQKREVTIWKLMAVGTIDDRMAEINERKKRIVQRAVGGDS